MRVLVIEDDPVIARELALRWSGRGWVVRSAGSLEPAHYGRLTWLGREGRAYVSGQASDLSRREFEVLGLLICHAPRLLPKRLLIEALAERNLEVSDSVAEVYVSRLRRKLLGSGTAIRTLRGFGYQLELKEEPHSEEPHS